MAKKANALMWIVREAKRLRREYPKRFETWKEYMAQASAVYASKHKGKSPVGHKHPKKKSTMHRTTHHRTAKKHYRRKSPRHHIRGTGIATVSRRHTDYNRNKVNITVGAVNKHTRAAKLQLEKLIGHEEVRKFKARLKREKTKIGKKIRSLKARYRRLAER